VSTHLDLDALADLLAGEGDRTHLDSCAACQARLAELAAAMPAVAASLGALELPAEPADLAGRLEAALAVAAAPPITNVLPLRSRSRWLPALAGVAAAAALVTGGALLLQRPAGDSTTSALQPYPVNETGTDYTAASLAGAVPTLLGSADQYRAQKDSTAPGVGSAIGGTAASESATLSSADAAPLAADPLDALRTTEGLASRLAALADPGEAATLPLAVDYAQYDGQPALVVVVASPKSDKVDVFVVGAACDRADARLLYFARVDKA
jgi:hypothetical protein